AAAMKNMGGRHLQLWDEADGFFYDVLHFPEGRCEKFAVRSLVGVIPLYAVERLEARWIEPSRAVAETLTWRRRNVRRLVAAVCPPVTQDGQEVFVLSVVDQHQLRRLLARLLDPEEFRSPWGTRSLSKHHADHPYRFGEQEVRYEPGEADVKL